MAEQEKERRRWSPSGAMLELSLVAVLFILFLSLAYIFDGSRRLHDFAVAHSEWHLRDLNAGLIFLSFLLVIFAFRRWSDARSEIGRQREFEAALRNNETRFRSLIENSRDISAVLDIEGTIHYVSPAVRHVLGYAPEELQGANIMSCLHPLDAPLAMQGLSMMVEDPEAARSLVYRYRNAAGSWCYLEGKGTATVDKDGKVEIILNSRDVTRKIRMPQDLQFQLDHLEEADKEARNLARFPEENPGPILRISNKGYLLYSNKAARTLLELKELEIGRPVPYRYREAVRNALESEKIQTEERNLGDRCWLITYCPVKEEGYVNLYGSEITDLKHAEKQLHMSQKLESVGLLAGGIAHDFNNILTVIKCQSELLVHAMGVEASLVPKLQVIDKAADRAAALTRQLLAFSRRQTLEPKVLELDALLGDLDDLLRRLVEENIELVTESEDDLWRIRADRCQIEQVLINLVVNARDAMPEGGRLTIEAGNVDLDEDDVKDMVSVQPGSYVRLSVTDTGCGMNNEIRARIFEPFFSTKDTRRGSGLGLSTCYGIVKQSGGSIWADSELGRGTTIRSYFPKVLDAADPVPVRRTESADIAKVGETVLLVEDDETIREIVLEVLEKKGYSVLTASNGLAALQVCASLERPIDLLLTDVVMPKMSGGRLYSEIAEMYPEVKALFMSGYTAAALTEQNGIKPDVALLKKPFTLRHLLVKVREVLDKPQAA